MAPLATDAQVPKKVFRLGYVLPGSPGAYTTSLRGLRQGLHDLGYLEGQNLAIEYRYADNRRERLGALAAQLVDAGLGARIFYVALDGFDTHAGQGGAVGAHANLLQTISDGIGASFSRKTSACG